MALTGTSIELDRITIDEVLDARGMPDPDFAFTVMGMGSPPEELDGTGPLPSLYASLYLETIAFMCERLGVTYDEVVSDHRSFRHVRISTSPPDASPREPSEPPNGAGTQ